MLVALAEEISPAPSQAKASAAIPPLRTFFIIAKLLTSCVGITALVLSQGNSKNKQNLEAVPDFCWTGSVNQKESMAQGVSTTQEYPRTPSTCSNPRTRTHRLRTYPRPQILPERSTIAYS